MNPHKVYQNISFAELMAAAAMNPHREKSLAPIRIDTTTDTVMDGLPNYSMCSLMPASPLSVVACIQDPTMYSLTALNLRIQQLSELSTTLQQRTEELKGGTLLRKRKTIHDLIGAAYNGSRFEPKDCLLLFQGLAHLVHVHFILLYDATAMEATAAKPDPNGTSDAPVENKSKGTLYFSSDPATWSNPVWIADFRGHWVAVPSDLSSEALHLPNWLTSMEERGWTIEWPSIDSTKADIVARLQPLPGWKDTDAKHLKEVLGLRLGRLLALKQLEKIKME